MRCAVSGEGRGGAATGGEAVALGTGSMAVRGWGRHGQRGVPGGIRGEWGIS